MLLLREGLLTSHAGPVLIPPSCPGLTITDEAGRLPGGQGYVAQAAIGVVVAILEPLQIGLDDALGMIGYQTVLADVDSVFEAEQVGHFPLGALAKPHSRP